MWDIGWRSIAVGLVSLLDLGVFASLVWAEFTDLRARPVRLIAARSRSLGIIRRPPGS